MQSKPRTVHDIEEVEPKVITKLDLVVSRGFYLDSKHLLLLPHEEYR